MSLEVILNGEVVGLIDFSKINDESDLFLAIRRNESFVNIDIEDLYEQLLDRFNSYKVGNFGYPFRLSYNDALNIPPPSYEEYMNVPPPPYSE